MLPLSTPDADLHASPDRVAGDTVARTQTRYRAVAALGARDAKTLRDILDGEERLELVAVTHHARSLLTEVEQHGAEIVLLAADVPGYSAELVSEIVRWPRRAVAVVGVLPAIGEWREAFAAAGGTTFYHGPLTLGLVGKFMEQLDSVVTDAQARWQPAPVPAAETAHALPHVDLPPGVSATALARAFRAQVIALWGSKGGDGKTTIATNLACVLAYVAGCRVLLVDADMNCGRVAIHINAPVRQRSLMHLALDFDNLKAANAEAELDIDTIRTRVTTVDDALRAAAKDGHPRLDVLFGITDMKSGMNRELSGQKGASFIRELLDTARRHYDYVIVDCGSNVTQAPHLAALKFADTILFVNSSDISSLYFNRATLRSLVQDARIPAERFKLVVNRFHPSDRIRREEISTYMDGMEIVGLIPEDVSRSITAAINERRPFVLGHAGKNPPEVEEVLRGLYEITAQVHPPFADVVAKRYQRKGWGALFGRGASA